MPDIVVNAPLNSVFDAVSDLTRHSEWAQHDIKIDETDQSTLEVGKTYTSQHANGKALDQLTVSELVANRSFGFSVVMPNRLSFDYSITLAEQDGGTRVTRTMKCTNAPGFNKLLLPLLAIAGPMAIKKNMAAMKTVIESET